LSHKINLVFLLLKIDMHAHVLPRDWPDLNKKFNVSGFPCLKHEDGRHIIMRDGAFFREIWPNSWDMDLRIQHFAEFDISVQVISTVPVMFSYGAEAQHANEMVRFLNDDVAQTQADHPHNVIALGTLPMQDTTLSIAELRRLKEQLNVPGVQIGSNINNRNLDDPELFPIFEAAQDLGIAVLVHPWEMLGSAEMPRYWLPWLVGMPAELTRAICCMIFGGVLERLPALRVCFAHGGGSFPFTIGRIEHGFNMRPDLVATHNDINPRDYLDRIYVDSVTHDPTALKYLLDVMGPERIMLGSDYPFPLGEQRPGAVIDAIDLGDSDRQRLYSGTALEWLGLDAKGFH
jgi:aminocarboxymuconate-semialdehyde decarboxylase